MTEKLKRYKSLYVAIICFPLMLLASCRVSLVPAYDAALQTQIENAAKATDMLYLKMMDASMNDKEYATYAQDYLNIEGEINAILLKNEIRPKSEDIVASIKILKDYFIKAKEDHVKRNVLSNAEALIYNEQLKALWKPVLIEEMALSKVR
ncbi:MAG: hypothetical protein JSS67_08060 [Bacteroidetes bacterium]|nr:hypothetical protein [Bacteroidota bacterium]